MRRILILLCAGALLAGRPSSVRFTGFLVDSFGNPRPLTWVTIGPGITVTPDDTGGVVLSVDTRYLEARLDILEQRTKLWRPMVQRPDGSWGVPPGDGGAKDDRIAAPGWGITVGGRRLAEGEYSFRDGYVWLKGGGTPRITWDVR